LQQVGNPLLGEDPHEVVFERKIKARRAGVALTTGATAELIDQHAATSRTLPVAIGLLVALYRFVPNRTFGVRDVLPGALLAGVLIEVLSLAFPIYARIAGGFNTYGVQFALFFLLATWFYLLSQLILLGAVFNRFRLGDPSHRGMIASPMTESRAKKSPVESIERKKAPDEQVAS